MYLLYTTPTSLVIKKEDSDKFLTIDRSDNGNIELKPASEITSLNLSSHHRILYCILGIVRIAGDSYLVVATQATNVATIDGAHILKIIETDFISYRTGLGSKFQGKELEETAFYQMQLLLSSGHFYFSSTPSFDITHTLQKQRSTPTQYSKALPIWERADPRFFWNKFIQRDFITNNLEEWCTPTIMGFVETKACSNVGGKLLELVLVSRRSRFRAGTRYNARGVDDDGNVANFVETEQIVTINKCTLSFVQVRGSVPVFWEQLAPQVSKLSDIKFSKISEIGKIATKVSNKIQICRTSQSTTPATQKHFKYTTDLYGQTTCLNLLALSKSGEKLLTDAFEHQLKILNDPSIRYTLFDYNDIIKGSKMDKLDTVIMRIMDAGQIGYYTRDSSNTILRRQNGVIRTNCKDCLDRTNVVQTRIAWRLLDIQLKSLDLLPPHSSLESYTDLSTMFKTVWANNGDDLSIQYAGSGSLKSNLTRTGQSTLMGFIDDGKKSVTRFYMNNFRDSARQEGIDQLLGLHHAVKIASQAEMNIQKLMAARATEYMQTKTIPLFVGTFNVGGEDPGYESLDPWLDPTKHGEVLPDIYAIGIQEVVELTPGKILATDPERGRIWETELRKSLASVSARHGNKSGYILIQSHQLVGLLLCIFVKDTIVESIRDVQYEITKVGLKGMAGNKGGIAVSLLYGNTRMCFVTAHLAAGQSNVEDRNNDYADINENTAFGRQRQIKIVDHTYVFWFGDFNYRIDMPDEEVRKLVSDNQLDTLFARDQLQAAIASGHSFQGFKEGALTFQPTYKYDLHTQIYDTSPKSRAPAWTDRVLWKARDNLEQRHYDRVELTLSDHRPVWSYLQVDIKKTDKDKERQLRKLIISSRSPNGADVNSPDIISWDDPSPTPASQTGHSQPAALIDFDFTVPPTQPTATPVPTITGLEDLHITDLRNPFNSNSPGRLSPTPNSNGHAAKKLPPLPPVPTGNPQQIRTSISPRSATIVSSMPVTHPSPNLPQFAATVTPIITPQQQLYQPQPQLQPQPQHPQQRISPTPNPNFASQPMRTSASYNPFMDQTPVQPQFQQQHQQYQQPAYQPDFFSTAQPLLPNSGPNHLMNKPIVPYGVQPAQQSKISEDDFFNQMMGAPGTSTLKPTPTNQMMHQRTTPSNNANPNLFDPFA